MSPFSRFAHYFIAVARCGSLRRAAEQLHISASAINRQILQAEEAFGRRCSSACRRDCG
jgi:DNA-binding transcriptional LysR family regulator